MTQRTPIPGAAMFAHLLGGFGTSAAKADDDTKDKQEDEARKAKKASAEDPEPQEVDEGDVNEGVDGDPKPDLDDVQDPDDTVNEDAAPEESDSDPKMRKAAKSGRSTERSRWARVMAHKATAGRVPSACHLLTTTTMGASAVISTLQGLPAAQDNRSARSNLHERMATRTQPNLGNDPGPAAAADSPQGFASAMKATMAKVRG